MNGLDKIMKKRRTQRFMRLKKLFKARDMSKKYRSGQIKVSELDRYFSLNDHKYYSTVLLAKKIIDEESRIFTLTQRPKRPVFAKK